MSEDKDKIVRGVYYDAGNGFGSNNDTYKQAHRILNTITLKGVGKFLNRQTARQTKAYRGFNSYVAKEPLQELQKYLATFTDSAPANNGYTYAFVAVYIFTKMFWAMPTKKKQPQ